jgi:hypothetical protein
MRKQKLWILLSSFAVFAFGIWALCTQQGPRRDYMMLIACGVLMLIAVFQSYIKNHGKTKR